METYLAQLIGLLRGDTVEIDGAPRGWSTHPDCHPDRPIGTPILVGANGPKGLDVAERVGADGVVSIFGASPGWDWSALFAFGTVLDDGESLDSPRVMDAAGPGGAVIFHGMYEAGPEMLDGLPGGPEWRAAIEVFPERRAPPPHPRDALRRHDGPRSGGGDRRHPRHVRLDRRPRLHPSPARRGRAGRDHRVLVRRDGQRRPPRAPRHARAVRLDLRWSRSSACGSAPPSSASCSTDRLGQAKGSAKGSRSSAGWRTPTRRRRRRRTRRPRRRRRSPPARGGSRAPGRPTRGSDRLAKTCTTSAWSSSSSRL